MVAACARLRAYRSYDWGHDDGPNHKTYCSRLGPDPLFQLIELAGMVGSKQPSEISSPAFFIAAGYRLSFKTYASQRRSAVSKNFMGAPWGLLPSSLTRGPAASGAALLNP